MDAIEMLKKDHEKVTELFRRFNGGGGLTGMVKRATGSIPERERRRAADQICRELDAHALIEEHMAVVRLQLIAVALEQALPVKVLRNRRSLVERRPALLVGHLEEEQKRQLLDVVAVRKPVIAQDVAVVPEFLDQLGGLFGHDRMIPDYD